MVAHVDGVVKPFEPARARKRGARIMMGSQGGDLAATPSVLDDLEGPELVRRALAANLRGRGGGWFPAGRKWQAVRVEEGDPVVVANGAEGEPGSIKDRFVMTRRAGDVVRGLVLAARAVGAREAILFLKGSFDAPAAALETALRDTDRRGLRVTIRRGDDGYITGEETAILETLEDRRPWPRPKPPLPAAVGLHGRPTLVQNVETLARVPAALADPEAFRRGETTLVSLWGDVRRPGVYDVPLGTPLSRIVLEQGGGAPDGIGLLFPSSSAATPLLASQADTPLDPDALRALGSGLGTASILVVGRSAAPLSVLLSVARFFEAESCGQCPPCTMGTASLGRIVRAVVAGQGRGKDAADMAEVAGFMSGHGYCAHCRTAAAVTTGFLARIQGEGAANREYARHPDPFAAGSPERAAIEAALARA
jgi:NADH:ubiquinone oxidoreductase subunit F (NADH-binding)